MTKHRKWGDLETPACWFCHNPIVNGSRSFGGRECVDYRTGDTVMAHPACADAVREALEENERKDVYVIKKGKWVPAPRRFDADPRLGPNGRHFQKLAQQRVNAAESAETQLEYSRNIKVPEPKAKLDFWFWLYFSFLMVAVAVFVSMFF